MRYCRKKEKQVAPASTTSESTTDRPTDRHALLHRPTDRYALLHRPTDQHALLYRSVATKNINENIKHAYYTQIYHTVESGK